MPVIRGGVINRIEAQVCGQGSKTTQLQSELSPSLELLRVGITNIKHDTRRYCAPQRLGRNIVPFHGQHNSHPHTMHTPTFDAQILVKRWVIGVTLRCAFDALLNAEDCHCTDTENLGQHLQPLVCGEPAENKVLEQFTVFGFMSVSLETLLLWTSAGLPESLLEHDMQSRLKRKKAPQQNEACRLHHSWENTHASEPEQCSRFPLLRSPCRNETNVLSRLPRQPDADAPSPSLNRALSWLAE